MWILSGSAPRLVEERGMKNVQPNQPTQTRLQPTLSALLPAFDFAGILQLLEQGRANGTLRLGDAWLRLAGGRVVKASQGAQDVVSAMLAGRGVLTFRAVPGTPTGPLDASPTALLLEAARAQDEAAR